MSGAGRWAAAGACVGEHATPLFLVSMALALVATVLVWRRVRSRRSGSGRRGLVIALAVLAVGVAGFAWLAAHLSDHSQLTTFDLALSNRVRQHSEPLLIDFFAVVTHAGDSGTRTVLALVGAAALLRARRPLLALAFAGALAGNGAITTGLKHAYGRARPLQPPGGEVVEGFSFPSGHSAGSLVACGLLAYLALRLLPPRWHLPSLCVAVALTLTVGASRIYIGAHFPSDVLAGFASGAAWLAVCVLALEWVQRQRSRPC